MMENMFIRIIYSWILFPNPILLLKPIKEVEVGMSDFANRVGIFAWMLYYKN